ncbi:hypothetical protein VIGAN_09087600, partial [Vigna angularis var. angularis]
FSKTLGQLIFGETHFIFLLTRCTCGPEVRFGGSNTSIQSHFSLRKQLQVQHVMGLRGATNEHKAVTTWFGRNNSTRKRAHDPRQEEEHFIFHA